MRYLALALALMSVVTAARAQDAIPDIKGTWSGKGKSIVFGTNPHHPGTQTTASPPRVRDFEFTFVVDGCDHQRAVRVGDFGRQQDHHRRRYRRLFSYEYPGAGPDRDVLRAQRTEPLRLHGRDVLRHDADQDVEIAQ